MWTRREVVVGDRAGVEKEPPSQGSKTLFSPPGTLTVFYLHFVLCHGHGKRC